MSDLAQRVAVRFSTSAQAAVEKTAGFIPDSFWKQKKAELKTILTAPLGRDARPDYLGYEIRERILGFFGRFFKDLKGFGVHHRAEQTLDDRLGTVQHIVEKIAAAYDEFGRQLNLASPYPQETAADDISFSISVRITTTFEESVKTLGDAIKTLWKTDARLIRGLTDRLLKKATPEDLAAIERSRAGDYGPSSTRKWQFLERVNMDGLSKRLVAKEKITWDPFKSIDFLREVLIENHSAPAIEKEKAGQTEFDLYGMKVIIDDKTVTPEQTQLYVRYLDEAYHALRSKKLGKAWYGTVFVRCKDCGGENQHGKDLGVGGHYHIGPNTISVYSRPSNFIVELVVHELGHRYWFKHMTSEQRVRFRGLVKTKGSPEDFNGVAPVSDYGKNDIDEAFAEVFAHYVLEYDITRDQLESFRSVLSFMHLAGDDHDFDDDDE